MVNEMFGGGRAWWGRTGNFWQPGGDTPSKSRRQTGGGVQEGGETWVRGWGGEWGKKKKYLGKGEVLVDGQMGGN